MQCNNNTAVNELYKFMSRISSCVIINRNYKRLKKCIVFLANCVFPWFAAQRYCVHVMTKLRF